MKAIKIYSRTLGVWLLLTLVAVSIPGLAAAKLGAQIYLNSAKRGAFENHSTSSEVQFAVVTRINP